LLVTKPLCLNIDEAKELYDLSIKNNVEILIDETFIFSNQVKELKKYVNDKKNFGELTFIDSTRVNLGLFQQNTNVIWDLAPHDIAISSYVLGEYPSRVRATSINALKIEGVEESYANCEYFFEKSEVLMTSLVSWLSPIKLRRMVFGGTNQTIVYDHLDYEVPLKIFNQRVLTENIDGVTNYDYSIGSQYAPHIKINEPLKNEIEQVVSYLKNKKDIFSNNRHAYNSVSVLTSLIQSAQDNGSYQRVGLI
jgi:predicted dehydrogenase